MKKSTEFILLLLLAFFIMGCQKSAFSDSSTLINNSPSNQSKFFKCDHMQFNVDKVDCYVNLALDEENESICDQIPDSFPKSNTDFCFGWIAMKKNNSNICKRINDEGERDDCLNEISRRTKISRDDFPKVYIIKAQEYLNSKFGSRFMDRFTFSGTSIQSGVKESSAWNERIAPYNIERKYVVEYIFDQSCFVNNSGGILNTEFPLYVVRVVFDENGSLYASNNVVDCVNNPNYCPPYNISTYSEAEMAYYKKCKRYYSDAAFKIYSREKESGMTTTLPSKARFLWYFYSRECARHCLFDWGVYLDPQTGKILDFDLNEVSEC